MADTNEKNAADSVRQEARTIGEELREKGAEAAEAAKQTARDYAERARDEAYAQSEYYRNYAADETGKVASALRRASQDLSAGSPQERFVGQIADGVADAADRMRGMTLSDIARDTTDFARRHPAAFLGGAALLGFAAARFIKASAREEVELYLPPANRQPGPASAYEPPSSRPAAAPTPESPANG
jgi:hypothetical protein